MSHTTQSEPMLIHTRASGTWEGGMKTALRVRDFAPIISDEPVALGGTDQGPTPMEYVVAALNGCVAVMVNLIARETNFRFDGLDLRSDGVIDMRGLMGVDGVRRHFQQVKLEVILRTEEPPERLEELRDRVHDRCPAINLLRDAGIALHTNWKAVRP